MNAIHPAPPNRLPWLLLAFAVLYLGWYAFPRGDRDNDFHYRAFGRLPAIDGGRVKPMDSIARTTLMVVSHRQSFRDQSDASQPAIRWLLDTMISPTPSDRLMNMIVQPTKAGKDAPSFDYKVFRIENDELREMLKLEPRSGLRYSIEEIRKHADKFIAEAQRVKAMSESEAKKMSLFDHKVAELDRNVNQFLRLASHNGPLAVPSEQGVDNWVSLRDALEMVLGKREIDQAANGYAKLVHHYSKDEVKEFNATLDELTQDLNRRFPKEMSMMSMEAYFNDFAPFYHCMVLYILIAVMGCVAWLGLRDEINRACYATMALVFAVHTIALILRMVIQGRPPVTNLYSSAIFIGWGCVLSCLITQWFYRNNISLVIGSITGALSLMIAHFLSLNGDTLEMMQAVLDTNFWLATHVTCVTLGYTACFVAGFMGVAYILLGIFTRQMAGSAHVELAKMTYGVLCFGMFFSFTGTVLGGIWADQSWGRFWGWDPKENGALLIVIWVALILHARWGGMVKSRGIAILAVAGNIITAWSWFGTNLLGIGLHAYGFMQGTMFALIGFAISQLVVIGLGLIPQSEWASFRTPAPPRSDDRGDLANLPPTKPASVGV
jgi:ABC-type transport system involved in cytochrome c biogenesis permease subunit